MRLHHIENRLEQQLALYELIKTDYENLTRIGLSNVTASRVQTRLTALKETWDKFSIIHDAIRLAINRISQEDKLLLQDHSYFSENLFSVTRECYLETTEKMNLLLERETEIVQEAPSTHSESQTSNLPIFFHHARLPRIDIPKFNGSPADWLSFKDLFSSLILANPTLTAVEKLQYLKTSLIGSASHLIKNTSLTADNFQKAWDALISFYENRRLLVNAALNSLTSLKRMTKESANEMEQLYTNITQIYRTLETLQRPVNTWDDFLVFIAVQRLDSESVKAWEHHLGPSKEPPTWKQFSEFLITRMLSLQAFEKSRGGKTAQSLQGVVKSHFQSKTKNTEIVKTKAHSCPICSSDHYVTSCPQYTSKTTQQRLAIVAKYKLCFNCLGSHRASSCRNLKRCLKCGHKHHTTIHQVKNINSDSSANPSENSSTTGSKSTHVLHSSTEQQITTATVLLATAQVIVVNNNEETITVRALIDQGSEISLITEHLVQLLRLPRNQSHISLIDVGAQKSNKPKGKVSFKIKPAFISDHELTISAYILPKLTGPVPAIRFEKNSWPHLQGLQLADQNFNSGPIDIILGADVYAQILEDGVIKGSINSPIAQRTKLGWIISGPSGVKASSNYKQSYNVSLDRDLHELLSRFWKLEEVPSVTISSLTKEDEECERHFISTYSRDEQGRYVVRLPFKKSINHLGDSRSKAMRMMVTLSNKLDANPVYANAYSDFMNEYERLQHMIRIPISKPEPQYNYYLPHHGVIRESSLTTRLRVVFNGSSRTSSGCSLNDLLHTGAKLQIDVFNVLLWFRQYRYVFSTDVEKMYRQIKVHSADQDFQRILWKNSLNQIISYQLTTVTYGLACAPFLALRTFKQLVIDEGANYPLATPVLQKGRYVDDIFGGGDSIRQAQETVSQLNQLCMAGGFPLQKWASNHPEILKSIATKQQGNLISLTIEENTVIHVLGLSWKPVTDTFYFTINSPTTELFTKRKVLSTVAKIFDPLGLLSPITIKAKIIIQELWSLKLNWDDPLPQDMSIKWITFLDQLQEIPSLEYPRWLGCLLEHEIEIHGFCDASQHAISAVVYIRSINQEGDITSTLACSKTKVAPLKRLTIPRLELSGAVLLTKLVANVLSILELKNTSVYMWTDSSITYYWINNHPSRWKDFIHNRVCYIQESIPHAIWKFVPGIDNPADCATRGLTPTQLNEHPTWWTGPHWLRQNPSMWPTTPTALSQADNLEERATQSSVITCAKPSEPWNLLKRYSSLNRLLRITSLCFRFIARLKKSSDLITGPITTHELETATFFWVKIVQQFSFPQEITAISKGQSLANSSSILRLTPFLDSKGLLRIGGRLHSSLLPTKAKHPLILPRQSTFTSLIIANAHFQTLHGGTQVTLTFIRNEFWIIGGRAPVRSYILKCVRCARYRQKRARQLMGQLPAERVTSSRPFLHSGVDYAGPYFLKNWRGKNSRKYKAYFVLFVCFSTSAVHLELVTDYTTETFISAYKRFAARRGICATLQSDCGTNLKGADVELQRFFSAATNECKNLATILANDGTQWIFNPPAAPHFGGKWEAGVKSVKFHLKRVIGDALLTYEEMSTLLTQVEAVLNSRPLCPLSEDPDDLTALTPGHFLIGNAIVTIPEPSLESVKCSRLSRWQLIRQMLESFWSRWSQECLQRHLAIYKWNRVIPSLKKDALVLVIDERYPPSKWPLGRITEIHPGKDGLTRVVSIRTQISHIKRPITKVCPLPIPVESL